MDAAAPPTPTRAERSFRFGSPEQILQNNQRAVILKWLLEVAGRRARRLIHLRYWRELSFAEMAIALKSSEERVQASHAKVLSQCRDRLAAIGIRCFRDL